MRAFSVLLLFLVLFSASCQDSDERPNIILVMTDDLGWHDVGFNGNTNIKTPNLDLLASEGIILKRFYSASPVCSPTRASVLTGRNPFRIEIPTANAGHLKKEEITIPELLKEQGYATAHYGKWHLGILTKEQLDANRGGKAENFKHYSIPTDHGYDEFFCTESKVPTYDPLIYPDSFIEGESKRYGWKALTDKSEALTYGTSYWKDEELKETKNLNGDDSRIIMDRVIPFIDESIHDDQPFFTTIWFHTPHLPVVSDQEHRDIYKDLSHREQLYYGTISAMDEQMGRLWDHLKKLGIEENTMIWFCSDNGPEDRTPGSAGVFRERKRSLYEGGVRVPAFVLWKAKLKGGSKTNYPMVTSDYLPTIIDFLGIDYPDGRPLDGTSLRDALINDDLERNNEIGFLFRNKMSWVSDRYKLISTNQGETFELYDLLEDKAEKNNILSEKGEIANNMQMALEKWMESVNRSGRGLDYESKD